jgi:hypothetical protein
LAARILSLLWIGSSHSNLSISFFNYVMRLVMFPKFWLLHTFRSLVTVSSDFERAPRSLPGFLRSHDFSITVCSSASRSHIISYLNAFFCCCTLPDRSKLSRRAL